MLTQAKKIEVNFSIDSIFRPGIYIHFNTIPQEPSPIIYFCIKLNSSINSYLFLFLQINNTYLLFINL